MSATESLQAVHSATPALTVGKYAETMYFAGDEASVTEYDQVRINGLLMQNQGVGIIAGRFDERLSIRMISGLAAQLLGYQNAHELKAGTELSLLNIVHTDEDFLRKKLSSPDGEIWGCSLKGNDGEIVSVRIGNVLGKGPDGEVQWYLSVRRLGEMQYDVLTGEYNRYGFINYISQLRSSGVTLREYAVLYIDIRGFKGINELYGADFGDQLLMTAYHHFSSSVLRPEVCARKNADQFLLLVRRDYLDLHILPDVLKVPYSAQKKEYYANCVCGICYIDDDEIEINTMIDCAKLAVKDISDVFVTPYAVFHPSMREDYLTQRNTLARFEDALEKNEFQVYYQPVVDCTTGKVTSAEALIRWITPDGIVPPGMFLPALEENGCISLLDEYVFNQVVDFLHRREDSGLPLVPISINVSRMDFFDRERTIGVCECLQQDALARGFTHFEITETSFRSIKELQSSFISRINSFGGKVYIDDFGVANSSIDLLSQYDFSVLKLDMHFIHDMEVKPKVGILLKTTIHMAHELNMKVIAEGVENENQLSLLRDMECDYIQGYYFSKPLPQKDFEQYLKEHL